MKSKAIINISIGIVAGVLISGFLRGIENNHSITQLTQRVELVEREAELTQQSKRIDQIEQEAKLTKQRQKDLITYNDCMVCHLQEKRCELINGVVWEWEDE